MATSTQENLLVEEEIRFKIVVLGDSTVGKTSFLQRYKSGNFLVVEPTIGVDCFIKVIDLEGTKVKLQMWDTCGQERFTSMNQVYFRHAYGIFVMYDITQRGTFENISKWLQSMERNTDRAYVKVLIGTKIDLKAQRQVSTEEALEASRKLGFFHFWEISSKEDVNINEAFKMLAHEMIRLFGSGVHSDRSKTPHLLDSKSSVIGRKCC